MNISVINMTHGLLSDKEIQTAIRAINRQISEDFSPYWNISGTLRLEGSSTPQPDKRNLRDMRGDAVLYLWDESDVPNALGYHASNYRGIPYGFVFIDIASDLDESWTVTLSHEALELLGDQQANLLVQGRHPEDPDHTVYHWHEMCDAVQRESYMIDDVEVSNFVLPLYFTPDTEEGSRNDFLGHVHQGRTLKSFDVNPGGYIGFYDPETGGHSTYMSKSKITGKSKVLADTPEYRKQRKNKARLARRGNRYEGVGGKVVRKKETTVAKNKKEVINPKYKLSIRSQSAEIVITKNIGALKKDINKKAGYYAYDISATAASLDQEIRETGFRELSGLAFEMSPVIKELSSRERLTTDIFFEHDAAEHIIVMTEVDGVFYWHDGATTKKKSKKLSKFSIPVQAFDEKTMAMRAGFFGGISKTVVRFFKHKIVKKVKDWVNNKLPDYLATNIERLAFNKTKPAMLYEFKLLDKEQNKRIGEIVPLKSKLTSNKKYLLFIHGIFSSTKGAFSEILLSRHDDNLLARFSNNYEKIIGFDHWTVAHSTLENAEALLDLLPDDCKLDIVCHSRGAGVTRCLLEHPKLTKKFSAKSIAVNEVIFVAGACQGSALANPDRIGSLVNVFSALSSVSGGYIPLKLFTGLLKAVQYGVNHFPGVQAMSPESEILKQVNKSVNQTDSRYIYMRSNYEPDGKLAEMLDGLALDKFIFDGSNDVVVPYDGAGTFDEGVTNSITVTAGAEFGMEKPEHIFHTKFFKERKVRDTLLKYLT